MGRNRAKHGNSATQLRATRRLAIESLELRTLLSAQVQCPYIVIQGGQGIAPADVQSPSAILGAYGINNIKVGSVTGNGAGQTIAIIDAYNEPTITSDLATFDSTYGLPAPPSFQVLNETGGTSLPANNASWYDEEALDVEWAHVVAPSANIILYEASGGDYSDLLTAVNTARNLPGVSVVSMSWGGPDSIGEAFYDSYFTTPSGHTGVTFLASSGDNGAPATYPATSPNVIGVGGTSLTTNGDMYVSETAWGSSGGGPSANESEPSYQEGVQSSGQREAPDVSFDADPNTGVPVYVQGGWTNIGGTSLACPCWAGLIAIADQLRVGRGGTPMDGKTQTLPMLYQLPASDFHDITSGSNGYSADPGYDMATGIGSPVANLLVPALAGVVTLNSPTLPADTVDVPYNQSLTASGGTGAITLTVSNLQNSIAGLTVPASGSGSLVISGTPTATGTEAFTVTATDASGDTTSTSYSITVNGAVTLGPATLPADTEYVPYNQTLSAGGGTGTITLAVSNIQSAIAGIVLLANGGSSLVISGTPTATGTETLTVTATDSLGAMTSASYSITVNGAVTLGPGTLPAITVNVPYNQTLTASGGTGTITLVVSNVQNPVAGLVVPANGNGSLAISGTPTTAGIETFTVTAIDSLGAMTSTNYSITVNGAVTLGPPTLPADTENVPYNQTISASGGTGTITLVVSNLQYPIAGLVVSAGGSGSLTISGTPTTTGIETFTVTAADSVGGTTSANYSITVNAAVNLGPAILPADTVNVPFNQTLSANNGTGTITLAISNIQNAVAGLEVPASGSGSVVISGTPTATGTETFTVTATDSLGSSTSTNYGITVNGAVTLDPATLPADTENSAYSQMVTAGGGTGTITLVVSNLQNAVAGLILPASGNGSLAIRGTPTATGTETFTVTATDSLGAMTLTNYSITVNGAVTLGPATLPADTKSVAYNQTLTASGGTGNITLTVSNIQNAIAGLVLPASGNGSLTISGTPTSAGTETFTITATDSLGSSVSTNYNITVNGAVTLGPATLPADTKNVSYNQTLMANGGTGTVTLVVSNIQNAIPGLVEPASSSASLAISGTPTATGTETFTVTATDSLGAVTSTSYSITVNDSVTLGPATLPADTANVPYNQTLNSGGGTGAITLVVSNIQNAIAGLILPVSSNNSLAISGTPTAAGTETFTVTATDSLGAAATTNYSITVNGVVTLGPATLPADTKNVAYHQNITGSGGTGNLTLVVSNAQNAITGLVVPAGGSNSIVLSGTPTVAGTETFTVTATDSLGASVSTNCSITVNGAVTLGPATLPADTVNLAYNRTITGGGGTGNLTLSVTNIANAIAGLTVPAIGSGSLAISGTPTAAGTETFTVTATDSLGASTSTNYSITVHAAVALGPATLPTDAVITAYNQTITGSGGTGNLTLVVSNVQNAIAGLVVPTGGSNSIVISGTPTAAGTETFTVTATDSLGASASANYSITVNTLLVPSVSGISPSTVSGAGGTVVTITGTGFSGATGVDFGSFPAASVVVNSSTQITATSPAGADTVNVTVTGPGGTSATSAADQLTYVVSNEIIDNSQPGFWSSDASTWTTSTNGLNGSSLISTSPNGGKQSQAAWWFSMPAGVYEISITYTAGANLTKDMGLDLYDGVGNWIGEIPVNEQVAPSSFTADGVAWQNLGAFNITSNVFHISTWNSSSDGAISVNGIQLQAAPIVDDSNTLNSYTYYPPASSVGSFATSGSWTTGTLGAFGGSHTSSSAAGSGASTAAWTMPVTPGAYEVDVTWPAFASLSASVTFNVYNGATKVGSVIVDQKIGPSGISYDGLNWQSLGSFTVTGTQLSVSMANTAGDGQVDADAVRILPAYQPVPIVSNGGAGFWSNTAWSTQETGLYGSSLVNNTANGSKLSQASWWFPVQPGEYEVYATWAPGSNLSSTAPLDVYNGSTYLSEPLVDEQNAPLGVTDQGVAWQSLGTFTITSDNLHLSTWNSPTNGAICVNGIRIVPVGA